ncbi:MAG: glucokinase [Simkaniaceae bacterium]|nr:glucokinase [Candidatus Sacchlamyda saccharinae]
MGEVILAGDIGGTKTHLALFEEGEKRFDAKFKSSEHENLRSIVKEFLGANPGYPVERACFGIAGPIQDRKCKATNLPWIIDADLMEREVGIAHVSLINDLEANAFGINCLKGDEFFTLNEGKKHEGNAALISAGTGLGEAGLYWDGKEYHPFACEGGHCSFAAENEIEYRLWKYLRKQYDHVSFERILSGPGLTNVYRFLIDEGLEKEEEHVKKAMEEADPSYVITEMGMKSMSVACERALDLFVSIYGSEAANLALKMLSVGGLYIGGGIAPKILNELAEGSFMKRFVQKGRFTSLLLGIPVKVVLNEHTALLGAAYYAQKHE